MIKRLLEKIKHLFWIKGFRVTRVDFDYSVLYNGAELTKDGFILKYSDREIKNNVKL